MKLLFASLILSGLGCCFSLLSSTRAMAEISSALAGSARRSALDRQDSAALVFSDEEKRRIARQSPLPDPPADPTNAVADDPAAAHFGQFLFFDERLSSNGEIACASCHLPESDWSDGIPLAEGLGRSSRHTPSLWNVAYNRWFFWDGRADSLWAQVRHPLEDPREQGTNRLAVAHLISGEADLRRAYEGIFGPLPDLSDRSRFPAAARPVAADPAHPEHLAWAAMTRRDQDTVNRIFSNVAKSIAAFERRLLSRRSAFDVFAEGLASGDEDKLSALSPAAQRGLRLFIGEANCRLCHHGPTFSDLEFHNILVPPVDPELPEDPGRRDGIAQVFRDVFNGAGEYSDDPSEEARLKVEYLNPSPENFAAFKTPTLRNVAVTAPYMHQGQFADLRAVLEYYSTLEGAIQPRGHRERILVPLELSEGEMGDLIAFLESLTDTDLPDSLLIEPDRAYRAGSEEDSEVRAPAK